MTIRLSTGLAASMLGDYGLKAMMNYGKIDVYAGEQPGSPDLPASGTLVAEVLTGGNPFIVGSSSGGALQITQSTTGIISLAGAWVLKGVATGTAGWWRWRWNAFDDGSQSFYYPRMDGTVGESLFLTNTSITAATSEAIESFNVQFRG